MANNGLSLRSLRGWHVRSIQASEAYKACIGPDGLVGGLDTAQACTSAALELLWSEKQGNGWDHPAWREVYVICQLCSALCRAAGEEPSSSEAMRSLDMALIMGAPYEVVEPFMEVVEPLARPLAEPEAEEEDKGGRLIPADFDRRGCLYALSEETAIPRVATGDIDEALFRKQYWKADQPVIITGAMQDWEALERWRDLKWWSTAHGHRSLPLEVGSSGDRDWHESVATMQDFVGEYLRPSNRDGPGCEVAYMAQHTLLDQIPSLRDAVVEPGLCCACSPNGVMMSNVWMGTCGTKTPLHFDSYDNILCQVAGFKYVRLYSKRETPHLYVDKGDGTFANQQAYTRKQANISQVDVSEPDLNRFPDFAGALFTDAILSPGEMLFIPSRYWHFVQSLTTAVSVNFWF
mmetsp:Transcript_22614/g.62771  ORF Transcript_22614/g.62771 Transcript_22614/m.62771 type:complete len:406 (+) Transcript_22614:185-1402(+)